MQDLANLRVGQRGRIVSFAQCDRAYRQTLMAMGLTRGTEFLVKRVAPLGCPIELEVRGFSLSVRRHEAGQIQIERGMCPTLVDVE